MKLERFSAVIGILALIFLTGCASTKTFPSPGLMKLRDGGFIQTIFTKDFQTKSICRLTSDNRQLWCHELLIKAQPKDSENEGVVAMAQDNAGGIISAGSTDIHRERRQLTYDSAAPLILRIDGNGHRLWQRSFDFYGCFYDAKTFQNGDVVAAGHRVLKLNTFAGYIRKGMAAWVRSNGDLQRYVEFEAADEINTIVVLPDQSTAFFGSKLSESRTESSNQLYWARVAAGGQIIDQHKIQISAGQINVCHAILAHDGGFVVVGTNLLEKSLFVAKLSPDGALGWKQIIKPDPSAGFFAIGPIVNALAEQADGHILVIGDLREQEVAGYAVCLDSAGKLQWCKPTLLDNHPCRFQAVCPNPDGTFTLYSAKEDEEMPHAIQAAILTSDGRLERVGH
jgi:hypothetical protein